MRKQVRSEVTSIIPLDKLEADTIEEVLQWIDSGVEICRLIKPDTPNKHLVSYSVLLDGEYVLLADHKNAQRWLPTGGHVEPNEHPRDSALREIEEELQIKSKFMREGPVLITSTETVGLTAGHTDISLWYVLEGNRNHDIDFDPGEFNDAKWFHKDNLSDLSRDPHMDRFLMKLF